MTNQYGSYLNEINIFVCKLPAHMIVGHFVFDLSVLCAKNIGNASNFWHISTLGTVFIISLSVHTARHFFADIKVVNLVTLTL